MRRTLAVGLVAVAALATGCGSSGTTGKQINGAPDPGRARLVAAAHLAPCPHSSGSGGSLPDLTLPCLGVGPAVHLPGLTGTPTVVNVWASWCGPCQQESQYLDAAYDADHARVRFLGVDTADSADSALSFAAHASPSMRYPSVIDEDHKVLTSLDQQGPPATVFLDAAGKTVHVQHGGYTSTSQLQHDITTYLHVSA